MSLKASPNLSSCCIAATSATSNISTNLLPSGVRPTGLPFFMVTCFFNSKAVALCVASWNIVSTPASGLIVVLFWKGSNKPYSPFFIPITLYVPLVTLGSLDITSSNIF